MPDTRGEGVRAAARSTSWDKPGCGAAGGGNSIGPDEEVPAGELWRYASAATVSEHEVVQSYIPFFLFLVPFGWTAAVLMRRCYRTEPAGIGMFTAAVIFFGMWVTVGRIREVRIFLPFALALAPLTVELAMQRFLPGIDRLEARDGIEG